MNIGSIDIGLLTAFDAVLRHGSFTRAARALDLTQPSISHAVERLRAIFGDPLFVRTAHGMKPTPRAEELTEPIRQILEIAKTRFAAGQAFDYGASDRTFTICASDIGILVLAPRILQRLRADAPGITLRALQAGTFDVEASLEAGDVDVAVGAFSRFGNHVFQQRLYDETYVVAVRRGHPAAGTGMSLKRYLSGDHIIVTAGGPGHEYNALERTLLKLNPKARIAARLPSFLVAPMIVRDSDLILTMPGQLAVNLAPLLTLKLFPPPLDLPGFTICQYWHERFHQDPGLIWFRHLIAELFSTIGSSQVQLERKRLMPVRRPRAAALKTGKSAAVRSTPAR
jgi:DNA-binding transcriptional LysR family regulator